MAMAGSTGGGAAAAAPPPVLLLGIGDTHGDYRPLFAAAARESTARAVLQVGDLTAGKAGRDTRPDDDPAQLATLPVPLVWIHGNHEQWDTLGFQEDGTRDPATAVPGYHLWPGMEYVVPGTAIRVVGLPGNYAPNWYEREKPFPGDRARHFTHAEVEAVGRFRRPSVLLMHEPFRGHSPGRIGAMGVPVLSQLVRRVQPVVCLTGHHHAYAVAERGHTLAIALPRAGDGYTRLRFTPAGELASWDFVRLDEQVADVH